MSPPPRRPPPAPRLQRGRLVFGPRLGKGAYGEVYAATWEVGRERRQVAVKLAALAHPDAAARLADEAASLAVPRPGIPRLWGVAETPAGAALVADQVEGRDLHELLATAGALPPRPAIELGRAVAETLDALHADGARTHRDLKPDNLRVSPDGSVWLLDHGLARAPEGVRHGHTSTQEVVGSPGFLAPERLRQEPASPAADVYALGGTLAAALLGRPLFAEVPMIDRFVLAHVGALHDAHVAEALADQPEAIAAVVRAAAGFNAEHRPSARDVADGLARAARDATGPSLPAWLAAAAPPPALLDGPLSGQVVDLRQPWSPGTWASLAAAAIVAAGVVIGLWATW